MTFLCEQDCLNRMSMAFPFHFLVDREIRIAQIGPLLRQYFSQIALGDHLSQHFDLIKPNTRLSFAIVDAYQPAMFTFESRCGGLQLQGQMVRSQVSDLLIFLGNPAINSMNQLTMLVAGIEQSSQPTLLPIPQELRRIPQEV